MSSPRSALAFALAATLLAPFASTGPAASQANRSAAPAGVAYELSLPGGKVADVYPNGLAKIYPNAKNRSAFEVRRIPLTQGGRGKNQAPGGLPDKAHLQFMLSKELLHHPYLRDTVLVVYRSGISGPDNLSVSTAELQRARGSGKARASIIAPAAQYTNDSSVNRVLTEIGTNRSERLFRQFERSRLSAMRGGVRTGSQPVLDFGNAYRLHIISSSVAKAVRRLAKIPSVAYVSPDFAVGSMNTPSVEINETSRTAALTRSQELQTHRMLSSAQRPLLSTSLPTNYAVTSSFQSMLNTPSIDVMAAYDEIQRHFNQLPGQGEIITNVSLGDLDDASATSNSKDPCNPWASAFGPTTEIVGNQRYLNIPSMPLIPTYTADANGNLNGIGEVCGVDPFLGEVGLDFSMMAPLPHQLQRGGEQGSGFTDMLGIAPGAQYRLVVPASDNPGISNIDAALLGAALQSPKPNVITASLGFGFDVVGFPGRFLEDDPLSEAIVASIVQNQHITVCISANDGTRLFTGAAIGPSGGSAATNVVQPGGQQTDVNDVALSTAPSEDFDSGSIAAGGTTLDDIFSNPPQYQPTGSPLQAQHAYAETRFTGFTAFSSGFGSRVNLSAPSDNVISIIHNGSSPDSVRSVIEGGTSASSPEIAAAAAVIQQVARLTGHPFSDPIALRTFLQKTGTPVPPVSQADTTLNVGPQINVARAVETLLESAGIHDRSSAARVAVEQRRNFGDVFEDGMFLSDTDPANIDLQHDQNCGTACADDVDVNQFITIAPDWEFVRPTTRYRLTVAGTHKILATTPWVRLLPATILNAAGLPLASSANRTVNLTYTAIDTAATSTTLSLTFGPAGATSYQLLPPQVPSVVTGSAITVNYDYSHLPSVVVSDPMIWVSYPGRINTQTGPYFHRPPGVAIHLPHGQTKGTVQIPVSALQGGGIYGIKFFPGAFDLSGGSGSFFCDCDSAYTRVVAPQESNARPSAPLLSIDDSAPSHALEIPYDSNFSLSYDVSNVPNATGAMLEISAPNADGTNEAINDFNNPNGSGRDNNGRDTGSIYYAPLSGVRGTVTLNAGTIRLSPTMFHVIRVVPMTGSSVAGEAGDVSLIQMDGIAPADGGFLGTGFAINGNATNGFLTSAHVTFDPNTGTAQQESSLETFDQVTTVTKTVNSESGSVYFTPPLLPFGAFYFPFFGTNSIFGSDVGLVGSGPVETFYYPSPPPFSYRLLNPTSSGSVGTAWNPPSSAYPGLDWPAPNQSDDNVAFFTFNCHYPCFQHQSIYTSNITANTSSPLTDISTLIQGIDTPTIDAFVEDTQAKTAYAIFQSGDGNVQCQQSLPLTIVSMDMQSGSATAFNGPTDGTLAASLDSSTHIAVLPGRCPPDPTTLLSRIQIYNLATKSGASYLPPPNPGPLPTDHLYIASAVDPIHHLFLVADLFGGNGDDNNNLTPIWVLDEHGNFLKRIETLRLPGFAGSFNGMLQVNPTRREGFIIGPDLNQIAPFRY